MGKRRSHFITLQEGGRNPLPSWGLYSCIPRCLISFIDIIAEIFILRSILLWQNTTQYFDWCGAYKEKKIGGYKEAGPEGQTSRNNEGFFQRLAVKPGLVPDVFATCQNTTTGLPSAQVFQLLGCSFPVIS